jgi:hypothetical protein
MTMRVRILLVYFNWELFDYPPYSPDLAPSDYHLFTYQKDWMGSQYFSNNEFTEGVNSWLTQAYKNVFPCMRIASIPAVTTLRRASSSGMYVNFVYNKFFLISCIVNSSPGFHFRIALVYL